MHSPAALRRARKSAERAAAPAAQLAHVFRSGRGGCFPHRVQSFAAARSWYSARSPSGLITCQPFHSDGELSGARVAPIRRQV